MSILFYTFLSTLGYFFANENPVVRWMGYALGSAEWLLLRLPLPIETSLFFRPLHLTASRCSNLAASFKKMCLVLRAGFSVISLTSITENRPLFCPYQFDHVPSWTLLGVGYLCYWVNQLWINVPRSALWFLLRFSLPSSHLSHF